MVQLHGTHRMPDMVLHGPGCGPVAGAHGNPARSRRSSPLLTSPLAEKGSRPALACQRSQTYPFTSLRSGIDRDAVRNSQLVLAGHSGPRGEV